MINIEVSTVISSWEEGARSACSSYVVNTYKIVSMRRLVKHKLQPISAKVVVHKSFLPIKLASLSEEIEMPTVSISTK